MGEYRQQWDPTECMSAEELFNHDPEGERRALGYLELIRTTERNYYSTAASER